MFADNEAAVARISAVVWLTMVPARRDEFLQAVKEKYHVETDEGVEALAALFVESRDKKTEIGQACEKFMGHVWHYDVDSSIAHQCLGFTSIDNDSFWTLIELVGLGFAATNPAHGDYLNRRFVEAVVAARLLIHRGDLLEEIGQQTEIARRGLRRSDAPPAVEDATAVNDSQGGISQDTPVLTYGDVQQLVRILLQAELEALHEVQLRGRDKVAWVALGSQDAERRMGNLNIEESRAEGKAEALRRAIETIVSHSPALTGWLSATRYAEQVFEPHPVRVRKAPQAGQRPREFSWGSPSFGGFIPALSQDADAVEIHFGIPESAGIHPLFTNAGEEVADRLRGIIEKLVNSAPAANVGLLRIELRDLNKGNDGTWRNCGHQGPVWQGQPPLAYETTAARLDKVPCPWCSDAQPVPSREDRPSLYAGDVANVQCHSCGNPYQLRIEAAHHLYARPVPK